MRRSIVVVVVSAAALMACGGSSSHPATAPATSVGPPRHASGNPFAAAPVAALQADRGIFVVRQGQPILVTDVSPMTGTGRTQADLIGLSAGGRQIATRSGGGPYSLNILDDRGQSVGSVPEEDDSLEVAHTLDGWLVIDHDGAVNLLSQTTARPRPIATIPSSPTCHGFDLLVERPHSVIVSVYSAAACQGPSAPGTTDIYEVDTSGRQRDLAQLGPVFSPQPPALVLGDGHTLVFESDVQNDSCYGHAAALMEVDLDSGDVTPIALPKASSGKVYALGSYWATTAGFSASLAEVRPASYGASTCPTLAIPSLREFGYANGAWSPGKRVTSLTKVGPHGWSIQASKPLESDSVNISPAKGSTLSLVSPNGDRRILDRDASQTYRTVRWAPRPQ